jgi:hypothetical protein
MSLFAFTYQKNQLYARQRRTHKTLTRIHFHSPRLGKFVCLDNLEH